MDKIYTAVKNYVLANGEHFITIHETEAVTSGAITLEDQAKLLAEILNDIDT